MEREGKGKVKGREGGRRWSLEGRRKVGRGQ